MPFPGDIVGVIAGHLQQTPPAITDLTPSVPQKLVELVESMMSKNADDRPSSMVEIAAATDVAAEGSIHRRLSSGELIQLQSASRRALASVGHTINTNPGAPKRRWRLGLAVMLGTVLAAAASASIWLSLAG